VPADDPVGGSGFGNVPINGEHGRVTAGLDCPGCGHDRPAPPPVLGDGPAPMPWEPPVTIATLWFCSLMTVPSSAAGERGVTGVWGERRRLHAHPGVQRQRREIAFIPAESGACHRPSARPWPGSAQSRSRDPCPASSRARSASRWVVASTVSGAVSAGTATVNVVRNSLPPGSGAGVHGFSVCRAGSFG
jgi:hypothetical protein